MRGVVNEYLTDNCPHLSASIAFYTFFSLFPLTLAAISILGFMTNDPDVQNEVVEAVTDFVPVESDFIAKTINGVSNTWEATGIVAIIGLLWGGSSVFHAIRKSLNAAWGIKRPRAFVVDRFVEFCMMVGLGILLLASFGATAVLSVFKKYSINATDVAFFKGDLFWNAMLILVTIAIAFVTFMLLYKFIPNTRVRWRDVWGGALLAAVGFEGAKQVFVWYATTHSSYNVIYGTVSNVIAVMVWLYISAVVMLFCGKLTAVYSRSRMPEEPAGEETSDTVTYLGPLQAPVENMLLKGRQVLGDAIPSFSSVSWLGPVGVARRDARKRKLDRTRHGRPHKRD
ncbi:MAG: YihY/virulence factor BrkB family protein [Dehalococcoidia bacterium]